MTRERLVPTHCHFCSVGCGLYASIGFLGKLKQVEPRQDFLVNEGNLCSRGIVLHEIAKHPERLRKPLIRDGGRVRRASWSEALRRVAEGFAQTIKEFGPSSIAFYGSSRLSNETVYLFKKLANEVVGTPHFDLNDRLGTSSAELAYKMAFGCERSPNPLTDLLSTQLILIIGGDPSSCHPVLMRYIFDARERGAKIIVVDPRRTQTAMMADIHLQLRPDTDVALLNGLLNVIIESGLLNRDFVLRRTKGFEEVRWIASKYDTKTVSKLTDVKEEKIVEVARLYARTQRAMILHTRGIEQKTNGVSGVLACINLVLATGKVGKIGCGCIPIIGHVRARVPDLRAKPIREESLTAFEMIDAISRGDVKAMYILASNPAVSMPNTSFVKDALKKLNFLVVQDVFFTDTCEHAHVVLPGSFWAESEGTITSIDGRVLKLNKAISPPDDAMEDWAIICHVAKALGAKRGFDYKSTEDIFEEMKGLSKGTFLSYSGISYRRLKEEDGTFFPCEDEASLGVSRLYEETFATEDGLAVFHPVEYTPPTDPPSPEYPYTLITFKTAFHFLTASETKRVSFFLEKSHRPYLEVHPSLAERLGVEQGDKVVVKSKVGEVELEANVTDVVREDCVAMPMHWGGARAANVLVPQNLDRTSKIPAYKSVAVTLRKA